MSNSKNASTLIRAALLFAVAAGSVIATTQTAEAGRFRRQYYSSWNHHPTNNYHYCRYYYTPVVTTTTTVSYDYHYVITYPSQPQYRYYYNPVRRVYWGRFEVDKNNKPVGYSLLKNDDRKSSLKDIPESAFPKASKMPPIPGAEDGELMSMPSTEPFDLPEGEKL